MKESSINDIINCPIIFYSNFSRDDEFETSGTVSIRRFKNDVQYFMSSGYKFYSLNELYDIINNNGSVPEKSLCLAFIDGFESEYTLAFEVIKQYGIHVDIFIDPMNIGIQSNTGIPRFTWEQTRIMCASGLVNIQGFYNNISNENATRIVSEIVTKIKQELGDENGNSFLNSVGDTITINSIHELTMFGLRSQVIFYKQLCMDAINNICFGHISMENSMSVEDFEKTMIEYKNSLSLKISLEIKNSSTNESLISDFLRIDNSVYLDIKDNPIITNRPSIAFPMSVLGINDYKIHSDFLAMEFISLMAIDKINYLGFDNFDYRSWPMLETYRIGSDVMQINNYDPLIFIYNALKNGYCIDVCSDAFYIPGKFYYNNKHISHNILIIGYDATNKTFKALTHNNIGKYTYLDVTPKNLVKSLSTMYFEHFTLLRKNNWYRTYYSTQTIKQLLSDYNNSFALTFYSKPFIDFFDTKIVGAKANEHLCIQITNGDVIAYSNITAYIEHKQCMSWRIKYIAKKEKIDISPYSSLLSELDDCRTLLSLSIKYNLSRDVSIKNRIIAKIHKINTAEHTVISLLLEQL